MKKTKEEKKERQPDPRLAEGPVIFDFIRRPDGSPAAPSAVITSGTGTAFRLAAGEGPFRCSREDWFKRFRPSGLFVLAWPRASERRADPPPLTVIEGGE
jgi:hypothetical protein